MIIGARAAVAVGSRTVVILLQHVLVIINFVCRSKSRINQSTNIVQKEELSRRITTDHDGSRRITGEKK